MTNGRRRLHRRLTSDGVPFHRRVVHAARTRPRRLAWRLAGPAPARALILAYHRVVALDADPSGLSVHPDRFAEHLDLLLDGYDVLPLQTLLARLDTGTVPARTVVITADDGYGDNLHEMRPLLAAAGAPATVFVATGYVGGQREFWWDETERTVAKAARLGPTLRLALADETRHWHLAGPEAPARVSASIRSSLMRRPREDIVTAMTQLRAAAGEDPEKGVVRPTHRPLDLDELGALAADDLIEVGAHTRSHANLAAQSRQAQDEEIRGSRDDLERWLDRRVTSLSFPFGWRGDHYVRATTRIAEEAGLTCSCTMHPWPVSSRSSRSALPRLPVGDWDGDAFAARLAALLGPARGSRRRSAQAAAHEAPQAGEILPAQRSSGDKHDEVGGCSAGEA